MTSLFQQAFSSDLTLQNLRYQPNRDFFIALTACFKTMKEMVSKKSSVNEDALSVGSNIEKVVFDYTGMQIDFKSSEMYGYNAYVIPADLDKNNVLLAGRNPEWWATSKEAKKHLKKADEQPVIGVVNTSTGKVSGVYSQVTAEVFIAKQILADERFTPELCAAIFAHELGHNFTYFLYMGRVLTASHVMAQLSSAFKEIDSEQERAEFILAAAKKLDVEVDVSGLAKYDDVSITQTVLITQYQRQVCSATNTEFHDERTWEALADQYVSRLGAPVELAKGLDLIMRMYGDPSYRTTFKHIMLETVAVTAVTLLTAGILPLLLIIVGVTGGRSTELYDSTPKRFERIRLDIVQQLKQKKLPAELRERLLNELKDMDKLMSAVTERQHAFDAMFEFFSSNTRRGRARAGVIQDLEKLANNELFAFHHRFNQLNK